MLYEWANEHLQMDLGMGNEIRAWMNEPFCWDTLIVKIPRLAGETSWRNLAAGFNFFLPGLMLFICLLPKLLTDGQFPDRPVFRCFPREKNTLRTDCSQSVLPSFSGRANHRGRNPRYALYHRHVDSASPLCCHDRLSGRCNRVATGHRSLYRCRSRCACMLLTVSPVKALVFLIFLTILQQIEGNFIYPRVVGHSIGLPGIWVLAAVIVGGGAFGIWESCSASHLQQPSTGCSVPQSIKAVQQAARLLKNKQKSNRAYALCVF